MHAVFLSLLFLLNMHAVLHYFLKYNTDLVFMDVVPRSETTIVSNSIKAKKLIIPSPSNLWAPTDAWISASHVKYSNRIIWLSCLGHKFILPMLRLRWIFPFLSFFCCNHPIFQDWILFAAYQTCFRQHRV